MDFNDSKNEFLVCTLYDMGSLSHGQVFQAITLPVAWRAVDQLVKGEEIPVSELLLFVHGVFDSRSHRAPYQPYVAPVVYRVEDRSVLTADSVGLAVEALHAN